MNLRKELIETTNYMFDNELVWGNSGNISARVKDNKFLITKSGSYLSQLDEKDFIEWEIGKKINRNAEKVPSKEVPMHQAIYDARPEINAVLHASPLYGTMAAISDLSIPSDTFIEGMYYLERVEKVPYAHPGSNKLGELVAEKALKTNIILLENHGVLVYDVSLKEARMALHTLEFACEMLIKLASSDVSINELPQKTVKDFLDNSGYKPRREWD